MNHPISRKIILYSALFFTAAVNIPRLFLLQNGVLMNRLIPFSWAEWMTRAILCFVYALLSLTLNKRYFNLFYIRRPARLYIRLLLLNLALMLFFSILGGAISRLFIYSPLFKLNGAFIRFFFITALIFVEIKILASLYYASLKEKENAQLRHANTSMELALLKSQLNPHFFFNSLSSLAGVVAENPQKAQQYITNLSKVFRYSLGQPEKHLVPLKEELDELQAYGALMKMRYENGFNLLINVDTGCYGQQLPHMSLQPLVENALKHNIVSGTHPLTVTIRNTAGMLEICNNIQPLPVTGPGTGIGLFNLNERCRILTGREIDVTRTNDYFTVKLPLIH